MVIGPTPPGTGVICAAISDAAAKSTSPTRRVLPLPLSSRPFSGASMRLMPTSITHAPGFTQSPLTSSAMPTAATKISAWRHMAGRSAVREWAIVTVQFSLSNNCATGLPTKLERPIMTACLPLSSPNVSLARITLPKGVHGVSACSPDTNRPALAGLRPSTSLLGSIVSMTRCCEICAGTGNCTNMPFTAGSAFNARTLSSSTSSGVSAGRRNS